VLAFTVIGAMLAPIVHWDRVVALVVIYFLALGIGAHALDGLGRGGTRPWGRAFSRRQLGGFAAAALGAAYAIGIYYMLLHAPWLWLIALLEGFFLLAYNLEWFDGRFHTDGWFALAWGVLPVLAGYVLQTNQISLAAVLTAAAMGLLSLVEIKASRPYKALKRSGPPDTARVQGLEAILKALSLGVILMAAGLLAWRWGG
jgi:hypothetical protein